jgi:hypothetical protein
MPGIRLNAPTEMVARQGLAGDGILATAAERAPAERGHHGAKARPQHESGVGATQSGVARGGGTTQGSAAR